MLDQQNAGNNRRMSFLGEKGEVQRVLLLLLLLAVVLFGYVYFFTGLIVPHDERPAATTTPAEAVKKPLPPRAEQAAISSARTAQAAKAVEPAKEQTKAAASPEAGQSAQAVKKEAPKQVQPQAPPQKKAEAPAPPAKKQEAAVKPEPQPTTKGKIKAEAAAEKKTEKKPAADAQEGTRKEAAKTAKAASSVENEKVPAAKGGASGNYTLYVGDFVLQRDVSKAQSELKKAGIAPVRLQQVKKSEPMHRLHVADFATRKEAEDELKKISKVSPAAFILPENGKHVLYAGSFFDRSQAVIEMERLSVKIPAAKISLRDAEVKVAVKRMTAGSFEDKETAAKEAARLEKLGISSSVATKK